MQYHINIFNRCIKTLLLIATVFIYSACDNDNEPCSGGNDKDSEVREVNSSILLYAVASNNLYENFKNDSTEICTAASSIDLDKTDILIYSVIPDASVMPRLERLVKTADGFSFKTVKEYDRSLFSTDPRRISEVISDYNSLSKSDVKGLILWSHATGWLPDFSDHVMPDINARCGITDIKDISIPANHSFGYDKTNGEVDHCDIIELSEAIPDNCFSYIWFDCCYMSAIEVLYQLRNKTRNIVAYPTEILAEGMPYDLTIPFLAKENYSLLGAADALAAHFKKDNKVFTIALIDTRWLEPIADIAEKATLGRRGNTVGLQRYSRRIGPFYDFGQYTLRWGESLGNEWDSEQFKSLLNKLVVYKASSERDFSYNPILPENFSGISVHYFNDLWDDESNYYMSLDWFKRVYTTVPEF